MARKRVAKKEKTVAERTRIHVANDIAKWLETWDTDASCLIEEPMVRPARIAEMIREKWGGREVAAYLKKDPKNPA